MFKGKVHALLHRYDASIWIRIVGAVLMTMGNFMVRPFLALYLYNKLDGNLLGTTMIVALQPMIGLICGVYAGGLSDRYGRKPLMVASLIIESATIFGYIFADSILSFCLLTLLSGVGNVLFFPAANAQITDVVPEERRAEVFATLHTGLNLGVALGPLVGVALYKLNPKLAFAISGCLFLLFLVLLVLKVPETLPQELRRQRGTDTSQPKPPKQKFRLREHKLLFAMTFAAVPFSLIYSQVETILPQHLKHNFNDYLGTFATIITVNGLMVVAFQILIARFAEKLTVHKVVFTAYLLVAATAFGYGWSTWFLPLILSEIIFTIGEMLNGPVIQKAVSLMAPVEHRGTYFAIFSSSWGLTSMFGPVLGAYLFTHIGGPLLFSIIGVLIVCAAFTQRLLVKRAVQVGERMQRLAAETRETPMAG